MKNFKEQILLADVGDVFLKFAFVEKKDKEYTILSSDVKELHIISWRKHLADIQKVFESFLPKDRTHGLGHLAMSFSPGVYKARIKEYVFLRENQKELVSSKEEAGFLEKAKDMLLQDISLELSKASGIQKEEFLIKHVGLVQCKIDGYEVSELQGFAGREIRYMVLGTFLLKFWNDEYVDMADHGEFSHVTIVHEAQAIEAFAKEKKQDGMYLDIGDSFTQAIGVRDGKILCVQEMRIGGDRCTHALEQTFGIHGASAEELKSEYAKGKLSEDARSRIHALFLPLAEDLGRIIKEWMQLYPSLYSDSLFLFGGGSHIPEFKEVLEKEYQVKNLFPQDVQKTFAWNHSLNVQYTPLILQLYGIS